MSQRLPIATGFFIELKDGRAISRGLEEAEVIPAVQFWLNTHQHDHSLHTLVKQWLEQKEKQVQAERQEAVLDTKREYAHTVADEIARKIKAPGMKDALRAAYRNLHGIE
jgi:Tol biopolymer transport system component